MDLHIYHHDGTGLFSQLLKKVDKIMATMQDLRDSVRRNTDIDGSVVTLLEGISTQLKDAQALNDPQAVQDVITQLDANTKRMADAVTANTPVTPPVPVV